VLLDGLSLEAPSAEEFVRRCGKAVVTTQALAARAAALGVHG
jgi:hypothetical protein